MSCLAGAGVFLYSTLYYICNIIAGLPLEKNSVAVSIIFRLKTIYNLDFISLTFFFFVLYIFIVIILPYTYNLVFDYFVIEAYSGTGAVSTNTSAIASTGISSSVSKASEGAIMATALAGGMKFAQKAKNVAVKIGLIGGSVAFDAGKAKNRRGNFTEDIGKSILFSYFIIMNDSSKPQGTPPVKDDFNISKFINEFDISKFINEFDPSIFFNLSGNSVLDLLKMIKVFNDLEYFFLYFIIYTLILLNINLNWINKILSRFLPENIVNSIMKSIHLFKKTGKVYVIIFIILLSYSIYMSNHYFSFFLDNFDKACEVYIKSKK
jgi:hypothetical protein